MKKIVLALFSSAILATTVCAQSFDGQIVYSIEVKGENAGMMSAMMPNSVDVYSLSGDVLVRKNGGMMPSPDILSKGAQKKSYIIMHNKNTAYEITDDNKKSKEKPTVENKGTEVINGYNCTKYLVKLPKTDKAEIYQYMWCTNDIKIAKPKGSELFLEDVEGFPVKVDQYMTINAMGTSMSINMEMVLKKIDEKKPDAKLFEIPKKYKVEPFDEEKIMKEATQGK